jgi:NAD(P)-dependent dehydrogenase (short-subunit alcohol dehydrogenase family)
VQVTLTGKAAIVTGAASGIGLATVVRFLESDAAGVVAVDLAPEPPDALHEAVAAGRVRYVSGDVGDDSTHETAARAALGAFGRIDVLVNNAGTSVVKPIHEHSQAEWDSVMRTNVAALFLAARHVVPVMIRQKGGVVLNTGSISGEVGIPGQGAYGPSKGAVHQLTRQMAIEYAPHGIRVNAVGCGTIDTPLVHRSAEMSGDPAKFWAMLRDNHPVGRVAAAGEVADFLTFLASDRAGFFTGAILMMDGGFTAR